MLKKTKQVISPDDWHPSLPDGSVSVSLLHDKNKKDKGWRVAVWGDDDYGLERYDLTINESYDLYREIVDGVTQKWLHTKGFIGA